MVKLATAILRGGVESKNICFIGIIFIGEIISVFLFVCFR